MLLDEVPVPLLTVTSLPDALSSIERLALLAVPASEVAARVHGFYVEFLVSSTDDPPETSGGVWRRAPGGLVVCMDRQTLGRKADAELLRRAYGPNA